MRRTSYNEIRVTILFSVSFNVDFIENFSEHTNELRKVTHNKAKWEWNDDHQGVFNRIKNTFCEYTMLSCFNPCWETEVICDGYPFGVSGILT